MKNEATKNTRAVLRRQNVTPCAQLTLVRSAEAANGEPSRTIRGYAILFNTPSDPLWADEEGEAREVIAPEAVTLDLLNASDIKLTMYHDRQLLLARSNRGTGSLTYGIDEHGVWFETELPRTAHGDIARECVERGDIAGCSFAFSTRYWDGACVERSSAAGDDGRTIITYTVRSILAIYDFTLASDPAYPDTSVETIHGRERDSAAHAPSPAPEAVARQVAEMRAAATKL